MSITRKIIISVLGLILVAVAALIYLGSTGKLTKTVQLDVSRPVSEESLSSEPESIEQALATGDAQQSLPAQEEKIDSVPPENSSLKESKDEKDGSGEEKEAIKTSGSNLKIVNRLVGWGFQKSAKRTIDTIIIHSSYDALGDDPYDVSGLIAEYKAYSVSPHYLIDRKGAVYRLVSDQNIAYHAGESQMPDGRKGVNAFSIGVEMMTTKKDKLTEAQYLALNQLVAYLKENYTISEVLGHNQIAPGRKDDPWNFDWKKLNK